MTQLHSTHASLYHEMYQHIFDYESAYNFYDSILRKYDCHKILELGCGSGMLARSFLKNGYNYLGLDLHNKILEIARKEIQSDRFVHGDMRNLSFKGEFDAVLMAGQSIAYMIHNNEIIKTFRGIHQSLKDDGMFIFDSFEAYGIFDNLEDFNQNIKHGEKRIQRINKLTENLETGWTWDWKSKYIIESQDKISEYEDLTTLRAFTKDEIGLLLKMANFEVIEIIEEESAMTLITQKK